MSKERQHFKVFLGGTCNGATWREEVMRTLDNMEVDYFNPVVMDWTSDAKSIEDEQKDMCSHHLYIFTPKMLGFYAVAEVMYRAMTRPEETIFCLKNFDANVDGTTVEWSEEHKRSWEAVIDLLKRTGVHIVDSIQNVPHAILHLKCEEEYMGEEDECLPPKLPAELLNKTK